MIKKIPLSILMTAMILFIFKQSDARDAHNEDPFVLKRKGMVEEQIIQRGISNPEIVEAFLKVKRHFFVPVDKYRFAYEDYPVPIGYGQTISQPFIVAYMTQAANLRKDDRVLEIGTGSGYQAAILAEIVKDVYSIEIVKPLAESAEKKLQELGYHNIRVKQGDGYLGWPEYAPFDAIIVTAAPDNIPEELVEQLKIGGRMVVPVGSFEQELYVITKYENGVSKKSLLPVRFVPMIKPEK